MTNEEKVNESIELISRNLLIHQWEKETILSALEKQILKRPITYKYSNIASCPTCNDSIGWKTSKRNDEDIFDYCPNCGQRIYWEE